MQATCDHEWQVVDARYGHALFRYITYKCRKCGKMDSTPVGEGPPR
jgi:hypothetical protein